MRTCSLIIALTTILIMSAATAAAAPIKIQLHDLRVGLDDSNGELLVSARIEADRKSEVDSFYISLTNRAQIRTISAVSGTMRYQARYTPTAGDSLLLRLPVEVKSDKKVTLEFEYVVPLGKQQGQVMILDRNHHWYPNLLDQTAPFKMLVQVPEGFDVFVSGDLQSTRTESGSSESSWESEVPVMKISLIVGRPNAYSKTVHDCDSIKVYYLSDSLDLDIADDLVKSVCAQLAYYTDLMGPYPHKELRLVKIAGLPSVLIANGLIAFGDVVPGRFRYDDNTTLLQALASQWIGSGVYGRVDDPGYWLITAAVPYYLKLMYLRSEQGEEVYRNDLEQAISHYHEIVGTEYDVPIVDVTVLDSRAKLSIIQGKGPYLLDLIADAMGQDKWVKLLRTLFKSHLGRALSYSDFMKSIGEADSSGAAATLAKKWFSEKGMPSE